MRDIMLSILFANAEFLCHYIQVGYFVMRRKHTYSCTRKVINQIRENKGKKARKEKKRGRRYS